MKSFFIRMLVLIFCTTIARGIVFAFGLDTKAANAINGLRQTINNSPETINALAWLISGSFGLLALLLWITFHVDQRLYDAFMPKPKFGSFYFVSCIPSVSRNINTGNTDAEIRVELKNSNDFPIGFRAILKGNFNGKTFIDTSGTDALNFEGIAYANQNTSLILKIQNVPAPPTQSQTINIQGSIFYDITYFIAPSGKRTHRTSKNIIFQSPAPLQNKPGTSQSPLNFLFKNEIEE